MGSECLVVRVPEAWLFFGEVEMRALAAGLVVIVALEGGAGVGAFTRIGGQGGGD